QMTLDDLAKTIVTLIAGGVLSPWLQRLYARNSAKLTARIDGPDFDGIVHLTPQAPPNFFADNGLNLEESFIKEDGYLYYEAEVSVRNVRGTDVKGLTINIVLPREFIEANPKYQEPITPPLLRRTQFITYKRKRFAAITGRFNDEEIAVMDSVPIARIAFIAPPRFGDFAFLWRVSANSMAHPGSGYGKQTVRLSTSEELHQLLQDFVVKNALENK